MPHKSSKKGVVPPWLSYVDASLSASLLITIVLLLFFMLYAEGMTKKLVSLKSFNISQEYIEEKNEIDFNKNGKNEFSVHDLYKDKTTLKKLENSLVDIKLGTYQVLVHYNPANITSHNQHKLFDSSMRIKSLLEDRFPESKFILLYAPEKTLNANITISVEKVDESRN